MTRGEHDHGGQRVIEEAGAEGLIDYSKFLMEELGSPRRRLVTGANRILRFSGPRREPPLSTPPPLARLLAESLAAVKCCSSLSLHSSRLWTRDSRISAAAAGSQHSR